MISTGRPMIRPVHLRRRDLNSAFRKSSSRDISVGRLASAPVGTTRGADEDNIDEGVGTGRGGDRLAGDADDTDGCGGEVAAD